MWIRIPKLVPVAITHDAKTLEDVKQQLAVEPVHRDAVVTEYLEAAERYIENDFAKRLIDAAKPEEEKDPFDFETVEDVLENYYKFRAAAAHVRAQSFMLTPAEMAELTGTSESSWRNRAAAGELPGAIKKGKQWLIPRTFAK